MARLTLVSVTRQTAARWAQARRCLLAVGLLAGVLAMHGLSADHAVAIPAQHAAMSTTSMPEPVPTAQHGVSAPHLVIASPVAPGAAGHGAELCLAVLAAVGLLLMARWRSRLALDVSAVVARSLPRRYPGPPRVWALSIVQLSIRRT